MFVVKCSTNLDDNFLKLLTSKNIILQKSNDET